MMQEAMTAEELAEMKEMADAATPGPWEYTQDGFICGRDAAICQTWNRHEEDFRNALKNGPFIAAARTAVPHLLAEVERTRGFIEAFIGEAADCDCDPDRLDAKSGEAFSAMLGNHIEENCELRDKIEKAEAALAEKDAAFDRQKEIIRNYQALAAEGFDSPGFSLLAYESLRKELADKDAEIARLQAENSSKDYMLKEAQSDTIEDARQVKRLKEEIARLQAENEELHRDNDANKYLLHEAEIGAEECMSQHKYKNEALQEEIVRLQAEAAAYRKALEEIKRFSLECVGKIPPYEDQGWINEAGITANEALSSDAGKAMLARVEKLEKVAEAARALDGYSLGADGSPNDPPRCADEARIREAQKALDDALAALDRKEG